VKRLIYFGPPGTGKTTTLLQRLEEHLRAGVPPDRIAFLTFTRRAKREALERVEQVLGIVAKDLPFFSTIHSMAFKALKLKKGDVMGEEQLEEFGQKLGVRFKGVAVAEFAAEGLGGQEEGDVLMALDNLARLRGQGLEACWRDARCGIEFVKVANFSANYANYKKALGLLDFTDVLLEFARSHIQLPIDVAFIDEAQDLSALQWLASLQAIAIAETQYVAGDDDQAIYRWAGADVQTFMDLTGERVVLDHSYRLPKIVHTVAQRLASRIKVRVDKQFTPRDAPGRIVTHATADSVKIEAGTEWLWLVRNRYLLTSLQRHLEERGVVYSQHGRSSIYERDKEAIYAWERLRAGKRIEAHQARDMYRLLASGTQITRGHKLLPGVSEYETLDLQTLREQHGLLADGSWFEVLKVIPTTRRAYYRKLLREHKSLKLTPRVQLETIHGAKGAQADHVALFTEQSRRVWDEAQRNGDDEHRVWYVGATRARESLHVVMPTNRWAYQMPSLRT
jgi:DNA helicase II / ATP-dependent DNA helicase PcrA